MIDNTMELTREQSRILLVRELMMRIPYGVKLEHKPSGIIITPSHFHIHPLYDGNTIKDYLCDIDVFGDGDMRDIDEFRMYLVPLSSLTNEQICEYNSAKLLDILVDFCNKNHIDHNHLIDNGLADDGIKFNIY
jgi:hypothetical protein